MPDTSSPRPVRHFFLEAAIAGLLVLTACARREEPEPITAACRDGKVPAEFSDAAGNRTSEAASVDTPAEFGALKECLEIEKARLETRKLDLDVENGIRDLSETGIVNLLVQQFAIFAAIIAGLFALWRYGEEKKKGREESQNARFEGVVAALGSTAPQARIGAAALLPTFLERDYQRFYVPVFKLAVGYLVPQTEAAQPQSQTPAAPPLPPEIVQPRRRSGAPPEKEAPPVPPLRQMLASALEAAYPLALVWLVRENDRRPWPRFVPQPWLIVPALYSGRAWSPAEFIATLSGRGKLRHAQEEAKSRLDAEAIEIDGVNLSAAAFPCAYFPKASFRWIDGSGAKFGAASLDDADFTAAKLQDADFSRASVTGAFFTEAKLHNASFREARARGAKFYGAKLGGADFSESDLGGADFAGADFSTAKDGVQSNIEEARSLEGTNLVGATGLTDDQIERCRKKNAKWRPAEA